MNILITGGASGLGNALTNILANDQNNKVFFTYNLSVEKANEITSNFDNTIAIKCDFGKAQELNSLVDQMQQIDVDVLINNAWSGEFIKNHFHKTKADDFQASFETNLLPTIKITQAAIAWFRKKKQGKIITILTSGLLNTPPIGSSVYMANKAYLKQLTKMWAHENGRFNITSNSVSPSFMQTEFTASIDERIVKQIIEEHPLKKLLTVNEVAETVRFLVFASNHLNGDDIVMNAGVNIR